MNTIFKTFHKVVLYGGLEKEQYRMISSDLDESNRKTIVVLSFSCLLIFALRLWLKYSGLAPENRVIFTTGSVFFGVLAIVNIVFKNNRTVTHLSAYLFIIFYLTVGIFSAVSPSSIQERTTLYLVFLAIAPMLFALNAVELTAVILPAELLYLILIGRFQSAYPVYITNKGNSLFFSVTSLLLGIYMANRKISGIYNAYMNAQTEKVKKLNSELTASRKELQKALTAAEQANRAKTVFLNHMSHDIRTPMNAIIGFTTLAETRLSDPDKVKGYLDKTMTASQHLLSLINDVLDMSRIESGNLKLENKSLSLTELVQTTCTIVQTNISLKNLTFSVHMEDLQQDQVLGDRLRLQQIFLNLLGNAVKFTPAGGTIEFSLIQKSSGTEGRVLCEFHIKDSGIGMSKEFQEHIFEAFSREESSTVNAIQGSGLGMSITKNLVDLMKGNISVESEEGHGTEFTVTIPFSVVPDHGVLQNTSASSQLSLSDDFSVKDSRNTNHSLAGKHILLVEDNELNLEIAKEILSDMGLLVDTACDGKEAVKKITSDSGREYDLVLMDIQMPNLNGYEACRQIRSLSDPLRANLPIIAMTANAFEEDKQQSFAAGMNGHLSKPIDISQLYQLLCQFLC